MIYLYGFVATDGEAPPERLLGVGGCPVSLVPLDGLTAVVSRVPDEEYGQDSVERHARDLEWLGEQGAAHERAVTWFVDRTDIVPVPLLTLYASLDHLAADAAARSGRVRATLARLAGRREWDLKVSYDARRLEENLGRFSEEVAELDRELDEAAPGRRYLLERKRAEVVRTAVAQTARRLAGEVLDDLSALADESVTLALPKEAAQLPVVLRAALLVPRDEEADLRERLSSRLDSLRAGGIEPELSGPWAAYRFVERADG